jgi:hypothetical protein
MYCKKTFVDTMNEKEINSKYYNLIGFKGGLETKIGLNEL